MPTKVKILIELNYKLTELYIEDKKKLKKKKPEHGRKIKGLDLISGCFSMHFQQSFDTPKF